MTVEPNPESMKCAFIEWFNENVADFDVPKLTEEETFIVWFCYIIGNAKCLISTYRPDHMYYEVTYHRDANCLYVDAYKKFKHDSITINR